MKAKIVGNELWKPKTDRRAWLVYDARGNLIRGEPFQAVDNAVADAERSVWERLQFWKR